MTNSPAIAKTKADYEREHAETHARAMRRLRARDHHAAAIRVGAIVWALVGYALTVCAFAIVGAALMLAVAALANLLSQ